MIPLYSRDEIRQFAIPDSDYVIKGIRSYIKCYIGPLMYPYALFSHEIANLRPRTPAGTLSRMEVIQYLKIARQNEVLYIMDEWKEQNLRVSEVFLDRLLEEEFKERRKVAMARKIQRAFRDVMANPEYQMCKRRLLREYDELMYPCK